MSRGLQRDHRPIGRAFMALLSVGLLLGNPAASRGQDAREGRKPAVAAKLPALIEEALWWLPEDTQTVIVDQRASKYDEAMELGKEGWSLAYPWLLSNIRKGEMARQLTGAKIRMVLEGSRKFRFCRGLGMVPYEGATIILLDGALDEGRKAALREGAAKTEPISGHPVSRFDTRIEMANWTFFIATPRPDVLVIATDRGYIEGLLSRMGRRAKSRALPETLAEWKVLDPASPWWAIRHYDPADIQLDPTSALAGKGGWYVDDRDAVGFVFQVDAKVRRGSIRHLSKAPRALDRVGEFWRRADQDNPMTTKPEIRETEAGEVEVSTPLDGEDKAGMFFFILSAALGHAICL